MKYENLTKKELVEWCYCLENNYNVINEQRNRTLDYCASYPSTVAKLKDKLDIAVEGLEKLKHIGETKKLGAVYQTAERTLAEIGEKK